MEAKKIEKLLLQTEVGVMEKFILNGIQHFIDSIDCLLTSEDKSEILASEGTISTLKQLNRTLANAKLDIEAVNVLVKDILNKYNSPQ